MHKKQLIVAISIVSACSLACASGSAPASDCGRMALSEADVDTLLQAWAGHYLMPEYCAVGTCPPSPRDTVTLVIDADRKVFEWLRDGSAIKTVDLNGTCVTGLLSTQGEGLGSAGMMSGKIPSEDMVVSLQSYRRFSAINMNWPDPSAERTPGLPDTPERRVWSGSFHITGEEVLDFPPDGAPEPRRRAIDDTTVRQEIWLKPTGVPGMP